MSKSAKQGQELVAFTQPWEKIPGETAKAFRAFALFRDLGASRSQSQVAEYLVEDAPHRKSATVLSGIKRWSVQHRWMARAGAYDAYLDQRRREQAETETREMERRYRDLAGNVSRRMAERVASNRPEGVEPLDVDRLSAGEFVRMLERLQGIEERATGARGRLNHLNCVPVSDLKTAVVGLYEGLLVFIPDELRPRAAQWAQAFVEGDVKGPW